MLRYQQRAPTLTDEELTEVCWNLADIMGWIDLLKLDRELVLREEGLTAMMDEWRRKNQ